MPGSSRSSRTSSWAGRSESRFQGRSERARLRRRLHRFGEQPSQPTGRTDRRCSRNRHHHQSPRTPSSGPVAPLVAPPHNPRQQPPELAITLSPPPGPWDTQAIEPAHRTSEQYDQSRNAYLDSSIRRRLGARLLAALHMVGNPDQGRAGSDEVVFLCIVGAPHELSPLPLSVFSMAIL